MKFRTEMPHHIKTAAFLLLLFLSTTLCAQTGANSGKWQVGLVAGPTFNGLNAGTFSSDFDGNTAFMAGFFAEYRINESLQIRAELSYEQRNVFNRAYSAGLREYDTSNYVCTSCYYEINIDYTNHYLSIPVYAQYLRSQGRLSLGARLGLYYSLLTSTWREGYEALYIDPEGSRPFTLENLQPGLFRIHYSGDATGVINTYDAGIWIGILFVYALGDRISLQLDGNLQTGFAGLFEDPRVIEINNRTYSTRLGIAYKLFTQ